MKISVFLVQPDKLVIKFIQKDRAKKAKDKMKLLNKNCVKGISRQCTQEETQWLINTGKGAFHHTAHQGNKE